LGKKKYQTLFKLHRYQFPNHTYTYTYIMLKTIIADHVGSRVLELYSNRLATVDASATH